MATEHIRTTIQYEHKTGALYLTHGQKVRLCRWYEHFGEK